MAKKTLSEKEELFCSYLGLGLSPREAAAKCGYHFPERSAIKLLSKKEIISAIKKNEPKAPTATEIIAGLRRLSFGSIADVIRLITAEDLRALNPDELELSSISELKFTKNGGIEVKFFDRLKALEALSSFSKEQDRPDISFFEALDKSAAELEAVRRE